ncbi:hypothetical protein ACFL35_21155 [Candidatus Riflebacteria bacterium]
MLRIPSFLLLISLLVTMQEVNLSAKEAGLPEKTVKGNSGVDKPHQQEMFPGYSKEMKERLLILQKEPEKELLKIRKKIEKHFPNKLLKSGEKSSLTERTRGIMQNILKNAMFMTIPETRKTLSTRMGSEPEKYSASAPGEYKWFKKKGWHIK